jgi:hypothetical protein
MNQTYLRLTPKWNLFFTECGAFDGEGLSNTLLFELQRNWTGLLVEPNYIAFNAMKQKHRKVIQSFFIQLQIKQIRKVKFSHSTLIFSKSLSRSFCV